MSEGGGMDGFGGLDSYGGGNSGGSSGSLGGIGNADVDSDQNGASDFGWGGFDAAIGALGGIDSDTAQDISAARDRAGAKGRRGSTHDVEGYSTQMSDALASPNAFSANRAMDAVSAQMDATYDSGVHGLGFSKDQEAALADLSGFQSQAARDIGRSLGASAVRMGANAATYGMYGAAMDTYDTVRDINAARDRAGVTGLSNADVASIGLSNAGAGLLGGVIGKGAGAIAGQVTGSPVAAMLASKTASGLSKGVIGQGIHDTHNGSFSSSSGSSGSSPSSSALSGNGSGGLLSAPQTTAQAEQPSTAMPSASPDTRLDNFYGFREVDNALRSV